MLPTSSFHAPRSHASLSHPPRLSLSHFQAGCEWTATHTAQSEGWLEVWSDSARLAQYIIVVMDREYKQRFTEALNMEAQVIKEVFDKGGAVYVFDGETMVGWGVDWCRARRIAESPRATTRTVRPSQLPPPLFSPLVLIHPSHPHSRRRPTSGLTSWIAPSTWEV